MRLSFIWFSVEIVQEVEPKYFLQTNNRLVEVI
jgi:hypothetical protein